MKNLITSIFIFLFIAGCSNFSAAQQEVNPEVKTQLDAFNFWIGEWDVFKYNTDTLVGQSSISPILNGMAIQEYYEAYQTPYKGTSLNKYNFDAQRWEQYWVDNSGFTLHITGGASNGKMIMSNRIENAEGVSENRITWYRDTPITVRQIWDQKNPGDTEWQTVFDGSYRMKSEDK